MLKTHVTLIQGNRKIVLEVETITINQFAERHYMPFTTVNEKAKRNLTPVAVSINRKNSKELRIYNYKELCQLFEKTKKTLDWTLLLNTNKCFAGTCYLCNKDRKEGVMVNGWNQQTNKWMLVHKKCLDKINKS